MVAFTLLALACGLFALPSGAGAHPTITPSPGTSSTVPAFMTLYGYTDNSPPGPAIAHPCGTRRGAGGTGTYADPVTFATDVKELPWCEIIYVPYMERYFIHEDECSECDRNWKKQQRYRFDMWAGGDAASVHQPEKKALLRCERTWTRGDSVKDPNNPTITLDPPSNLPVTTAPIFSPPGTCWSGP
jgi:hypothetical protein